MGHVTITTPLSGTICHRCARTRYYSAVYQIWNLYVHSLRRYERRQKCKNLGGLEGYGSPIVIETSLFDRAHMTSYSTLMETMGQSCTIFELQRVFRRKLPILTHPTCTCCPRRGWSRSNFAMIFGFRKLESWGYRVVLFAWSYV